LQYTLGWSWPAATLAGLAVALLVALYQGGLTALPGVPSLVVTLGGLMSFRGAAFLVADGKTQPVTDEFSPGESEDPVIFVNCDVGVGAGIVLNDQLFTGVHGVAGEIGHTIMQADGPLCSCGRHGCADAFIGSRALSRPRSVDRAAQMLGLLLQNLWATFDPCVIVVGGASCLAHPGLLEGAVRTLAEVARSAGLPMPVVRPARYGLLAPAVGAAALVLHQALRPLHRSAPAAQTMSSPSE
jgi:hypothetical protein